MSATGVRMSMDSAFVDVVSNILLVLIVTALLLILTMGITGSDGQRRPNGTTALPFHEPQSLSNPPWSQYLVAVQGRLFELDLQAVALSLRENRLSLDGDVWLGETTQVRFQLLGGDDLALRHELGLPTHDVDTFLLSLWLLPTSPKGAAVDSGLAALPRDQLVSRLMAQYRQDHRAPTFFVYASGMDLFAPLNAELVKRGARFRWVAVEEDAPMEIYRDPSQFDDFLMRW